MLNIVYAVLTLGNKILLICITDLLASLSYWQCMLEGGGFAPGGMFFCPRFYMFV